MLSASPLLCAFGLTINLTASLGLILPVVEVEETRSIEYERSTSINAVQVPSNSNGEIKRDRDLSRLSNQIDEASTSPARY